MTVCVCVKVNECMVFAADSATSIDGGGKFDAFGDPIQQVYRNGNKVFQLHHSKPLMTMTAGMSHLGNSSIATLAKSFRNQISDGGKDALGAEYTVAEVAELAQKHFVEQAWQANPPKGIEPTGTFELWIGGYGASSERSELWRLQIVDGNAQAPTHMANEDDVAIMPGGQPHPVMRLINGFGWKLERVLMDNGVTPETHSKLYETIAPELYLPLAHPLMPIKDAIDLAEFLADLTKKVFRFRAVAEYVSGEIDIAVITRFEGFKWIKRKHYYPGHLNMETNHD